VICPLYHTAVCQKTALIRKNLEYVALEKTFKSMERPVWLFLKHVELQWSTVYLAMKTKFDVWYGPSKTLCGLNAL